jgi:hypothetical protein
MRENDLARYANHQLRPIFKKKTFGTIIILLHLPGVTSPAISSEFSLQIDKVGCVVVKN